MQGEADDSVVVVLCTCPPATAEGIAQTVVDERLAACVNIVPAVTSVYRWKGEVQRDEEAQLVMKTTAARFDALSARVAALHPYETPEILGLPVGGGAPGYLAWVARAVEPPDED